LRISTKPAIVLACGIILLVMLLLALVFQFVRRPLFSVQPRGVTDVSVTPEFSRTSVSGATGYEPLVALDDSLDQVVISKSRSTALGAITKYEPSIDLDANTSYY